MNLAEEIVKAKTQRVKLAEDRAAAWEELDACLLEQVAMKAKEAGIRDRIRALQGELYPIDVALGEAAKAAKGKVVG